MIQMIGIRKGVEVNIREKLSLAGDRLQTAIEAMGAISKETVLLSTCNRTEIYFFSEEQGTEMVDKVFDSLKWDKQYREHIFYKQERGAVLHLFEVACGFHSKLLGEDQILSQMKGALMTAQKAKASGKYLYRLFQGAIACSKQFRTQTQLRGLPVSASAIVIHEAQKRGIKSYLLLGFGEVGQLTAKYIQNTEFEMLYIAVRDLNKVDIAGPRIKAVEFHERAAYYDRVDCIISCTGAAERVLSKGDLPSKQFLIFDLAVPRDVEESMGGMENVQLYDIDKISALQDETYKLRKAKMESKRHLVEAAADQYMNWLKLKEVTGVFQQLQNSARRVSEKRVRSFRNKMYTKDNLVLAETLINSTSNAFLNRSIEVLKEECLRGGGEECVRIIKKIFQVEA
jgi:glutamyl-tRNA reductase